MPVLCFLSTTKLYSRGDPAVCVESCFIAECGGEGREDGVEIHPCMEIRSLRKPCMKNADRDEKRSTRPAGTPEPVTAGH